jgi:hypothetical protein
MDWFIQYRFGEADCSTRLKNLDDAIETACMLMDNGCDVSSIGYQTLDNAVAKPDIENIYSIWVRAKGSFAACA